MAVFCQPGRQRYFEGFRCDDLHRRKARRRQRHRAVPAAHAMRRSALLSCEGACCVVALPGGVDAWVLVERVGEKKSRLKQTPLTSAWQVICIVSSLPTCTVNTDTEIMSSCMFNQCLEECGCNSELSTTTIKVSSHCLHSCNASCTEP